MLLSLSFVSLGDFIMRWFLSSNMELYRKLIVKIFALSAEDEITSGQFAIEGIDIL